MLVDRTIAASFTDAFAARVRSLLVGEPMDSATFVGPVVDDRQKVLGFYTKWRSVAMQFA